MRSLGSLRVLPFGFGFWCFHEALGTLCDGEPVCISSCCFGLASRRGSCLVRGPLSHTAIQEVCPGQSPGRTGHTAPAGSNRPLTSTCKNPPATQATRLRSLGQENPLENSTDRGAWWATVHEFTESDTIERLTAWASLVAQMVKLPRSYPFVVFIDCVFCLLLVCIYGLGPFIVGVLLLGSFLIDLYAF